MSNNVAFLMFLIIPAVLVLAWLVLLHWWNRDQ